MPSPFPGMDPWLENPTDFPDVHDSLIAALRDAINELLPTNYFARGARRIWIDDEQIRVPDVSVHELTPRSRGSDFVNWETAMAEAGMLAVESPFIAETEEERYLEIREATANQLVTAVEILSVSNKTAGSAGRRSYLQKQSEHRAGMINTVEIDLLRAGLHTTMVPESILRQIAPDACYHVCVTVPQSPRPHYVAAVRLDQPLPNAVIPLRENELPIRVGLQFLFERIYDTGRYGLSVNYNETRRPPLTESQRERAGQLIQASRKK